MFRKILLTLGVFTLLFGFGGAANAQTDVEAVLYTATDTEESVETDVPSGWEMWWQGFKERATLMFTFDPVRKAERRIEYANQRMQLAERLSTSREERAQLKVEQMVQKANELIGKNEQNKEKWMNRLEQKNQQTMEKVLSHPLYREQVMDQLENRLQKQERLHEKVQTLREEGVKTNQRLLNALENENIPEDVKEHLETVKTRVDEWREEIVDYQSQKKQLQGEVRRKIEGAKEKLEELKEERQETVRTRVELRNQVVEEVEENEDEDEEGLELLEEVEEEVSNRWKKARGNGR